MSGYTMRIIVNGFTLRRGDQSVLLSKTEYRYFEALARRPKTRQSIMDELYADDPNGGASEASFGPTLTRLRVKLKKLGLTIRLSGQEGYYELRPAVELESSDESGPVKVEVYPYSERELSVKREVQDLARTMDRAQQLLSRLAKITARYVGARK